MAKFNVDFINAEIIKNDSKLNINENAFSPSSGIINAGTAASATMMYSQIIADNISTMSKIPRLVVVDKNSILKNSKPEDIEANYIEFSLFNSKIPSTSTLEIIVIISARKAM